MSTAVLPDQLVSGIPQATCDGIPTYWIDRGQIHATLRELMEDVPQPYKMLYDLTAIDERGRRHRDGQPASDFTVVYHLLSFERNAYIRLKVALEMGHLSLPTMTDLSPAANWYEREVFDLFGIEFQGHPNLQRIMLPDDWQGHPLRRTEPLGSEPVDFTVTRKIYGSD